MRIYMLIYCMKRYILAFDCGTATLRVAIIDANGEIISIAQQDVIQNFPQIGWVEQNPLSLWATQISLVERALKQKRIAPNEIACIGIASQRETVVMWEKETGRPVHNAISWQDRRTIDICEAWKTAGYEETIQKKTGLLIDPYFSASKIRWLFDHIPEAYTRALKGEILVGTIDTWLMWQFSKGKHFVTDYTNASRTMLFNIKTLDWDDEILNFMRIPRSCLPHIRPTMHNYGCIQTSSLAHHDVPILAVAGDQQAALFGSCCFRKGMTKNTYGIGAFLMMNTGNEQFYTKSGILSTVAWGTKKEATYALEGPMFVSGGAISWIKNNINLINDTFDSEYYSSRVSSSEGVYLVPAFVGIGAPHWNMHARGAIFGINQHTCVYHIVRATLESLGYQSRDVLEKIEEDSDIKIGELRADGGAIRNGLMLQFQSDILGIPVVRPVNRERTVLGIAYMAGLQFGIWKSEKEIEALFTVEKTFMPSVRDDKRERLYEGWKQALSYAAQWGNIGI